MASFINQPLREPAPTTATQVISAHEAAELPFPNGDTPTPSNHQPESVILDWLYRYNTCFSYAEAFTCAAADEGTCKRTHKKRRMKAFSPIDITIRLGSYEKKIFTA